MTLQIHRKSRRGIVILIVLSLLMLFIVLAVTFAIVAGQYRRAADATGRQEQLGSPPKRQSETAIYQLLRGTPTASMGSAVRYHDLLRDMYGVEGFHGYMADAAAPVGSGNQFMDIKIGNLPSPPWPAVDYQWKIETGLTFVGDTTNPANRQLSPTGGFYNGCVFSVVSGPARGASARIVGYTPPDPAASPQVPAVLRVVAMKTSSGWPVSATDLVNATDPYRFVVNGRPFNGTGVGYAAGPGTPPIYLAAMDSTFPSAPVALLPNYSMFTPAQALLALRGGVNESYDAPDYQNMFMGLVLPNAASSLDVEPSFHRRELVNYFRPSVTAANSSILARVVLRPLPLASSGPNLPIIHPNFTGSNTDSRYQFDPTIVQSNGTLDAAKYTTYLNGLLDVLTNGPWDVDNDGDGIPDSLWLDLGLPVQTATDGRKYKPLFAVLCTDLDGRLNVNAHDRLASVLAGPAAVPIAGATTAAVPYRGQGYGPPEISLLGVFGTSLTSLLTQRYGANGPGMGGIDLMTNVRFFDYPPNYASGSGAAYRSPPDLQGELKMGLSLDGQPQFEQSVLGVTKVPYQLDLSLDRSSGIASDAPFTAAEYERVLRNNDVDVAQLSPRLAQIVNTLTTTVDLNGDGSVNNTDHAIWQNLVRHIITTDSWDLPIPNVLNAANLGTRSLHVTDLLRQRLNAGGYVPPGGVTLEVGISQEIQKMLSLDLILGLRMDLNRPFGNGGDENGNSVVDDPMEAPNETLWGGIARPEYGSIAFSHTNGMDVNGDGAVNNVDRALARQLYARHLYVLALTLIDYGGGASPPAPIARQVAQWAVNVVDFRDADSIMTPFEYDPNPFDGWNVDGVINGYLGLPSVTPPASNEDTTGANVVWGCERPELLIMEGQAWHDRRTEDLATPGGFTANHVPPPDPLPGDLSMDQRLRPRSAAFIEIYNPWMGTDNQTTPPGELYTAAAPRGVMLNKVTPGGHPVWRLVIMDKMLAPVGSYLNNPDQRSAPAPRRAIYFANPSGLPASVLTNATLEGRRYYTDLPVAPVLPGRYAVVGSAGILVNGEYSSFVGRTIVADDAGSPPNLDYANTRRVALKPNANPNINQVIVYPGSGQPAQTPAVAAVGVAINKSFDMSVTPPTPATMSLSISEPLGGYPGDPGNPDPNWVPALAGGEGAYATPLDTPVDEGTAGGVYWPGVINYDGTTQDFAVVHLQRLADPTQNFHETGNPYLTIDSARIPLTCFNGLKTFGTPEAQVTSGIPDFTCAQRGDSENPAAPAPPLFDKGKLWLQEQLATAAPYPPGPAPAAQDPTHFFPYNLNHTLGSLNTKYLPLVPAGQPFPWLTWNDRPYVSQYELLQVPRTSSYDLLRAYDPARPGAGYNFTVLPAALPPLPYAPSPYGADPDNPVAPNGPPPFGHLTNFFWSTPSVAGTPPQNFYRLLEYAGVPSRFNATETILNPSVFNSTNSGTYGFHPPFNRVSNYRDPGRVNINTIVDQRVWDGILNGLPGPTYAQLVDSRRGYGAATVPPAIPPILQLNASKPTFFANPFRAPGSGSLVPLTTPSLQRNDIETTLLRSNAIDPDPTLTGAPLFQAPHLATATQPYNDARRNSYFRYQDLTHLGNLVTNHSNVYAVWITEGYFEVENTAGQLGQEIGSDTGEVKRHRSFYLIDRSIPVAYEPGENHNVDRCILLRRYIE